MPLVLFKSLVVGGLLFLLICSGCDFVSSRKDESQRYVPPDISAPKVSARGPTLERRGRSRTPRLRKVDRAPVVESVRPLYGFDPGRPIVDDFSFVNCVGLRMVWIKAGAFTMGRPSPHNYPTAKVNATWPVRRVTIERGFWIGETEVTQEQYERLAAENPSKFKGLKHPVDSVSWAEAVNFCRLLTEREAEARRVNVKDLQYRYTLPSEAQWEYACRAGTTSIYYGKNLRELAWFGLNTPNRRSQPVKGKKPNPWELYDMLGNVEEWCMDYYYHDYRGAPLNCSPRLSGESVRRSIRGGSWQTRRGKSCSSSSRSGGGPSYTFPTVGFRPVLVPLKKEM